MFKHILFELHLDHNLINTIDDSVFVYSGLSKLFLQGNNLWDIPVAIKDLTNLIYLDISNNISDLKQNVIILKRFSKLTLILSGNAFQDVPSEKQGELHALSMPSLNCNCSLPFLRNYMLQVTGGWCTSPPHLKGYHVSCFPIDACYCSDPLYITSETVVKCLNKDSIHFSTDYTNRTAVSVTEHRLKNSQEKVQIELKLYFKETTMNNQSALTGLEMVSDLACLTARHKVIF